VNKVNKDGVLNHTILDHKTEWQNSLSLKGDFSETSTENTLNSCLLGSPSKAVGWKVVSVSELQGAAA